MKKILILSFFILSIDFVNGQNTQVNSTNLQLANLTYNQINAIPSPNKGMMNYDVTFNCVRIFDGNTWKAVDLNSNNSILKTGCKLGEANSIATNSSSSSATITNITIDNSNNIIITGYFNGTFLFGSSSLTNTNNFNSFIAKYDANCNLQWIKQINGGIFLYHGKILINSSGEIIICGTSFGNLTFGTQSLTSNGSSDGFIAKVNSSNGDCIWLQKFGGIGGDDASSLTKDNNNNYYIAGRITGVATISGTSTTIGSNSTNSLAILKFSDSGNYISSVLVPNNGVIEDITFYDSPNILDIKVGITGSLNGNASFDAISLVATNNIYTSFVAEYSFSSNSWSWAKVVGSDDSRGLRIISKNQNYFVAGSYLNPFSVTTSCGTKAISISSTCTSQIYNVLVFLINYGSIQWLNTISNVTFDRGIFLEVDNLSNILISGTSGPGFFSKTKFDDINIATEGLGDAFIAKIGVTSGSFLWAEKFGRGNNDNINSGGFKRDANGILHIAGSFVKNVTIGSNLLTTNPINGSYGATNALFKAQFYKE